MNMIVRFSEILLLHPSPDARIRVAIFSATRDLDPAVAAHARWALGEVERLERQPLVRGDPPQNIVVDVLPDGTLLMSQD